MLTVSIADVESRVAVIVPFESPQGASADALTALVAADMERVNSTILSRTGSDVTMIPEVANHLISSGGKRLRPMLTLAMAQLAGYSGDGHVKLAAAVEFMHTATLLHDDVVDESELRRGKLSRAQSFFPSGGMKRNMGRFCMVLEERRSNEQRKEL